MSDNFKYTKELIKQFEAASNILLVCHINPDGDAIGAQLALYHYLTSKGKSVEMLSPNNLQEFLKWMKGADKIHVYIRERNKCRELIKNADLMLFLDFNHTSRLGEAEEAVMSSSAAKIAIDHHLSPGDLPFLIISDPAKSSTSELVYELLDEIDNGRFISVPVAEALYTGIITDTGNFEHGNYTPSTFRIVAGLLEAGIEKEKILDLVYNNFSADRMRLMGYSLNEKMVVIPEFRTAYITLTREELALFRYSKGDTEGFVNMPLSVKGVIFSALFIEKEGFIKISFRSKGKFPVNEFASRYFSGGGHMNASGGEYRNTLDNTVKYFLSLLEKNLSEFYKTDL